METSPYWKKIWYIVTIRTPSIGSEDIENILRLVGEELVEGIGQFEQFTEESFKKWKEKAECKDNYKLERLIRQLSTTLNLSSVRLWSLFCNYLMFEYNGKIEDMANIANYDMYLNNLLITVWQFYTHERMFLLKTMRHVLECTLKTDHPFNKVYLSYITKHKVTEIRKHILKQMKLCLSEIPSDTHSYSIDIKTWIDRNNREQLELMLCFIITLTIQPISFEELQEFLSIYRQHYFLNQSKMISTFDLSIQNSVTSVGYGACIVAFQHMWDNNELQLGEDKKLEESVLNFENANPVLLTSWALILPKCKSSYEGDKREKCLHFISEAINREVFQKLYEVLNNTNIMDTYAGNIIRMSIFKLIQCICDKLENGLDIFDSGSVALLSKLMEDPTLAEKCTKEELSATLYTCTVKIFPLDFCSFSVIAKTLLKHQVLAKSIIDVLLEMTFFTEEYGSSVQIDPVTFSLNREYSPNMHQMHGLEILPIVFPKQTQVVIWERNGVNLTTYVAKYSYFSVLYEHMYHLCYSNYVTADDVRNVEHGLEVISQILSNPILKHEKIHQSVEFNKCINLTSAILARAAQKENRNISLVKLCFQVFLSFINFNLEQAVQVMHVTNFLPVYTHFELSLENATKKDSLTHALLLEFVHEESKQNTHCILLLYLDFFHHCFKRNIFFKKVLVPGFTYILSTIFGNHLLWEYKDIDQKHRVTLSCLELIFNILQQNPEEITDKEKKSVYDYFLNSFQNNHFVIKSFITIIRTSYRDMFPLMQNETNWENGRNMVIFKNIKICLSLLMLFLNQSDNTGPGDKTIIDYCFYSDEKPNIVKIIVGFMNQYYDLSLSKLACRLLRKIAQKFMIPMLAYLEMDHFQVQGMFLQKLRDPFEEDEMKLLIIDFIATCVESGQNGMCAAFFNLAKGKEEKKSQYGDSVTIFMAEHLKSLIKPTSYLNNPLKSSMLELYHTLWTSRKSILIQDLLAEKHFWPMLADPLFQPLHNNDDCYAKILDIITLEIMKTHEELDNNLMNVLKKMFNPNSTFINNWNDHVVYVLEDDKGKNHKDNLLPGIRMLWSWKNFLMMCIKNHPEYIEDHKVRAAIAECCLKGLANHLSYPEDMRVLTAFATLYLYIINKWGITCYGIVSERLKTLACIYKKFYHYDEVVASDSKEPLLAIAPKTLTDLKNVIPDNLEWVEEFLSPFTLIVQKEYQALSKEFGFQRNGKLILNKNWNTLLMFGISILNTRCSEKHRWFFKSSAFLQKVLICVGSFIANVDTMPAAKVAVYFLVKYAESPLYQDFLDVDFKTFYYNINPPSILNTESISFDGAHFHELEEWWNTYRGILLLNIQMVQKLDALARDHAFCLINLHMDILLNILLLPKVTAEISALKLVRTCVMFFNATLKWKAFWNTELGGGFEKLIYALTQTLNSCVLLLLRPKMINGYDLTEKKVVVFTDNVPVDLFVEINEEILEIISVILSCFSTMNPDILKILDIYQPVEDNIIQIEHEFLFPNGSENLTFGTLLYTLHFLCKTLSQVHTRKSGQKQDSSQTTARSLPGKDTFIFVTTEVINVYSSTDKIAASYIKYPDFTGMSAPWLSQLNVDKVTVALEKLVTFLSQQALYSANQTNNLIQCEMLKRKMQGDLQIFHDYMKKRMHDYHHTTQSSFREKAYRERLFHHKRRLEFEGDTSRRTFSRSGSDEHHSESVSPEDEYLNVMSHLLQYFTRPSVNKI